MHGANSGVATAGRQLADIHKHIVDLTLGL
jgi:hypothetical protein